MPRITLRKFHRYISLLIAVQLLLWTISGIYFSFNKIENVRGEQYLVAETKAANERKEDTKKLDFESAKKIVQEKTILTPQSIEVIDEIKRGSEYRGRELPLYKVISVSEDGEEINVYQNPFTGEIVAMNSSPSFNQFLFPSFVSLFHGLFPVLSIKLPYNLHSMNLIRINTVGIDTYACWIGPGAIKGLYSTDRTERMFCNTSPKSIFCEYFFTLY